MKSIFKASALVALLALTSCAHHGKCHGGMDKSQCEMKDGKKECCGDKKQCDMKKEETKTTEEVKK